MNDEWYKQKELTKGEAILQLKMVNGVSALHIQGYAETEYNREYGFAVNLTLPQGITIDYNSQEMPYIEYAVESLATNAKDYLRGYMIVYKYIDGYQLYLDIADKNGNKDNAWQFDLNEKDMGANALINFATEEGLITELNENRFVMEDEEE